MPDKKIKNPSDLHHFDYFEETHGFLERSIIDKSAGHIATEIILPILENNPDLIILRTFDEKLLFIGPQCYEITSYHPQELMSMNIFENIHEDDREMVSNVWHESVNMEKTVVFEYRWIDREGEITWFSHRSSILDLGNGVKYNQNNIRDISIQKQFEKTLLEVDKRLTENNVIMKNKNIALEELLQQIEQQKSRLNDRIRANIFHLVMPLLNELMNRASATNKRLVELVISNLESVSSEFGNRISDKTFALSSRELEICNMIKEGLSSKAIADTLKIETVTVTTHRNNIRKKLGLRNSDVNLVTYLNSII